MIKPIFLLGEAMGANETRIGVGFVGSAGVELLRMRVSFAPMASPRRNMGLAIFNLIFYICGLSCQLSIASDIVPVIFDGWIAG